jgi:hypothetical protein
LLGACQISIGRFRLPLRKEATWEGDLTRGSNLCR